MPRDIPVYTHCAAPGDARSSRQLGGLAGVVVRAFFASKLFTIGAFLLFIAGLILLRNPVAWMAFGAAIIMGLIEFKDWYYNWRLLCVRDRDCAIGTVITDPTSAFDGDRKLNLMLAPFSQRESIETLLDHIANSEEMLINDANFADPPFHTAAPNLPVAAQRENSFNALKTYMSNLRSKDPDDEDADSNMYRQLLIGVIDRLMANPAKSFYNRYFRKDPEHIAEGTPLWDAIPEDFDSAVDWRGTNPQSTRTHENPYSAVESETLNPMFRFDIDHLVPYLHCEIEGYRLALFIDDLILAFIAWLAAMLALWAFVGPVGAAVALFVAMIVFLLKDLSQ